MSESFSKIHSQSDPAVESPYTAVSDACPQTGRGRELAEKLRTFQGQWVAVKDEELLVAARSPEDVVGWLAGHDQRADGMFRVPEDELALSGVAPL